MPSRLLTHLLATRNVGIALCLALAGQLSTAPLALAAIASTDVTEYASNSADEFVDQQRSLLESDARAAFQARESTRLETAAQAIENGGSILSRLPASDAQGRATVAAMLEQTSGDTAVALDALAKEEQSSTAALLNDWRKVREALNKQRLDLFEARSNRLIAGQLASFLSVDKRWFWLCGLLAMGCLTALVAHDRRHEIRRRLHGGKARAMGLSKVLLTLFVSCALITGASFIFGDKIYHWLVRIGTGADADAWEQIRRQNRELAQRLSDPARQQSEREIQARYNSAVARCKSALERSGSKDSSLVEQWVANLGRTQSINVQLAVQKEIAAQLAQDGKDLRQFTHEVAENDRGREYYQRVQDWIRAGLGLLLLGVTVTGGVLFQRGVRRRQHATRDTCPLCLGVGTFAPAKHLDVRGDEGNGQAALPMVECKRPISTQPYEECGFTFAEDYRDIVKLCFPTLGIPQAGKTHWLAMSYRELNRGNRPPWVQFERIKSSSSERFDRIVDDILDTQRRLGPEATQTDRIPHPLVFHFSDHDRWQKSHSLVNIFDYSGEVTRSHTLDESAQRQRALEGDGFFFFLDPTEPSETQVQALINFRDDLRLVKRLKPSQSLRTPVALVVSKIDLMVTESYADTNGDSVVTEFYRNLGQIGWDLSLHSIEARSQLVGQLHDTIWPGWDIERSISDLFGGRYMFFPLTPVGLNEPGERDLERRTIAPVGLFHPLLWLLHMNGYKVLKQS